MQVYLQKPSMIRGTVYGALYHRFEERKICTTVIDRMIFVALHCTAISGVPSRYVNFNNGNWSVNVLHWAVICGRRMNIAEHCTANSEVDHQTNYRCKNFLLQVTLYSVLWCECPDKGRIPEGLKTTPFITVNIILWKKFTFNYKISKITGIENFFKFIEWKFRKSIKIARWIKLIFR